MSASIPPGTGERIACLLTGRLAELQRSSGARVLLVAEYDPIVWRRSAFAAEQRRMTGACSRCAQPAGARRARQLRRLVGDVQAAPLYVLWHMNDAGNRADRRDWSPTALGSSRRQLMMARAPRPRRRLGPVQPARRSELGCAPVARPGRPHSTGPTSCSERTAAATRASRAVHDPRLASSPARVSCRRRAQLRRAQPAPTPAPDGVALAEPPILVVGDSYAHGDEVQRRARPGPRGCSR